VAKEGIRSCVARRATAVLAVAALGAGVAAGCGGETPPPEPVQTDATFPAHELWPGAASRAAARERRSRAAAREARRRAELRRLRASPTVPAALRRALLEGRLTRAAHDRLRRDYEAARAAVGRLDGARQAELAAVVASVEQLAAAGRLGPGRFAPAFEQLRRNTVAWTRDPMPAPGERRVAGPAVLQYYVGRGFQLHPLASWGRVNGLAHACLRARRDPRAACRRAALRRDLDGLAALAAPRGGFLAWEYYFSYGGGTPPWISGMAQATAVQALVRGARALGEPRYARLARRALGAFEEPPPVGVAVPAPGGSRYPMYSFDPGMRILNGELQAIGGLRDAAVLAGGAQARRLARSGDRAARRVLPRFDTGAWSLYSAGGRESTLHYHRLTTRFLDELCARTGRRAYCRMAKRFARYEREPPRIRVARVRGARARRETTLAYSLSKVSAVTVRVWGTRGLLLQRRETLPHGRHRIAWTPPSRGRFRMRVDARGPEGLTGTTTRTIRVVHPKPKRASRRAERRRAARERAERRRRAARDDGRNGAR